MTDKNIHVIINSVKMNGGIVMEYKITLKAARVNMGLTQKDVAEKLGISKESLANWEKGKTHPKINILMDLCELYNIPLESIFLK